MELILLIGALIVAWLLFTGLVNIVKTTVKTAFTIALVFLALYLIWGVNAGELWATVQSLPEMFFSLFDP
ncbi:hypothetical protein VB712_18800 [Spirulina sp. CCNP1310]|uniref:hypothetical protein n=1 Tax=Spirulina sp. CCNP1310 TaxID=3110249 RepID=UPI002B209F29|nr:hypothetical protein [Spirulina sp. CCNP1310]MEA5421278.1 hypothetical protein [Spirulina sp. CCNP1310]